MPLLPGWLGADVSAVTPEQKASLRARTRRPITDDEIPYLEALGAELRQLRTDVGLQRARLASLAGVQPETIRWIEFGVRRTRRPMLERLVAATLTAGGDDLDAVVAAEVVDHLCALAGPALAPASQYQDRVDRRRARRVRKAANRDEQVYRAALGMARSLAAAALVEYRQSGKLPTWMEGR